MTDTLREALHGLAAHRARTFLSGLGILFGVAAVIGILSIGEGARREQEALIEQLGVQNIQVESLPFPEDADERESIIRRTLGLSDRDVRAIRRLLPHAVHVGGMRIIEPKSVSPRPSTVEKLRYIGVDPEHLAASPLTLLAGRPLRTEDERRSARVVLLGERAARQIFGGKPALHRWIRIDRMWLRVVGIVRATTGGTLDVEATDVADRSGDVMMPLSTSYHVQPWIPEESPPLSGIQVRFASKDDVLPAADILQRYLTRRHREQPVTTMVVPLSLLAQSEAQQRIFNLVMGLIAGISLLVGGIGIMNIMLASVMERTKEIAIRLAVGASPRDIHLLFITEACLISLLGGALGIVAGYGMSWLVALLTGWSTSVSLHAVLLATVVSTLEGIIFGYLPARQAARLQPALAMRA